MILSLFDRPIEVDETRVDASPAEIRSQVREYERGERRAFDLSVDRPAGAVGDVLAALSGIPYGETRTYGDLAAEIDTAARVVGTACARNPVPVIVPCHRVVGSDGGLKGYSAADGVATKRRLLDHEAGALGRPVQSRLPAAEE